MDLTHESNIHLIEDMVYLPVTVNANWFIKEKYKEHIPLYWKNGTDVYNTGIYIELP